jgi:uncharacterized circularly permuted ATP-grasp superfamily protein
MSPMKAPAADDTGYPVDEEYYDEAFGLDGEPRRHARAGLQAVARVGPDVLARGVQQSLTSAGVRFSSVDGDATLRLDPVPRVITAEEWAHVKRGLAQRVRALNAFVADVYGQRRIVEAGVVPARVIDSAEYFEPAMVGIEPPSGVWIGIAGLDVVRDHTGRWLVLEDNLRTPSGFGYLHAARHALAVRLEVSPDAAPRPLDGEIDLLADALRAAVPRGARGPHDPVAAVLTDGPSNSAHWEHGWLAAQLGIPLLEPSDVEVRAGRLWARPSGERRARPIDVLYRRTDADRLDSPIGELLFEPIERGTLGVINQFGTGVADDKLTHAYVEDMIGFYLGEEPVLPSVKSYDLAREDHLQMAMERFDELVFKPRSGHGGVDVLIAPRAQAADRARIRAEVEARPDAWIAQELVKLSTHPTVVDGRLRPRHIDLRPFVFIGQGARPRVVPGGLTRVALDEGALVVNSSQNGGVKDTWVLPESSG